MRATAILVGSLVACVAFLGGCDEEYSLRFTNVTSEPITVRVLQDQTWMRGQTFVPADGGKNRIKVRQDSEDNLVYVVQADSMTSERFVINKRTPKKLYFRISPNGISGPTDGEAVVEETWNQQFEDVQIHQGIKIE